MSLLTPTAVNAGELMSGYMRGMLYTNAMLDREEERLKRQREQTANEIAGEFHRMAFKTDPKTGIPIPRSEEELVQSQDFTDFMNGPIGQSWLQEGMPDGAAKAHFERAEIMGQGPNGEKQVAINVTWRDEDGNVVSGPAPISVDPKTGQRSNSPDSVVVPFTMRGLYKRGLDEVYKYHPDTGNKLSAEIQQGAAHVALANLRNLPKDQQSAVIDQLLASGLVNPQQIEAAMTSGRPTRKLLANGLVVTTQPFGQGETLTADPKARAVVEEVKDADSSRAIREYGKKIDVHESKDELYANRRRGREAADTESRIYATARGNSKVAPIVADTEGYHAKRKHNLGKELTFSDITEIRQALVDPENPKSQEVLRQYSETTVQQVRTGMARQVTPKELSRQSPEEARQNISQMARVLDLNELKAIHAGLGTPSFGGTPGGAAARATIEEILATGKAEKADSKTSPKLPQFDLNQVKRVNRFESDSTTINRLKGNFDRYAKDIQDSDGSVDSNALNNAVVVAHTTGQEDHVKDLYTLELLSQIPYFKADAIKPKDFIEDIYGPIHADLNSTPLPIDKSSPSMRKVLMVELGLEANGVDRAAAVEAATTLAKSPQLQRQLEEKVRKASGLDPQVFDEQTQSNPKFRQQILQQMITALAENVKTAPKGSSLNFSTFDPTGTPNMVDDAKIAMRKDEKAAQVQQFVQANPKVAEEILTKVLKARGYSREEFANLKNSNPTLYEEIRKNTLDKIEAAMTSSGLQAGAP